MKFSKWKVPQDANSLFPFNRFESHDATEVATALEGEGEKRDKNEDLILLAIAIFDAIFEEPRNE